MKPVALIAAPALALVVGACAASGPPAQRAALDCPAAQGELTRLSQAADGKRCLYQTADGMEIDLQLMPVAGDPTSTLEALETRLLQERPAPAAQPSTGSPSAGGAANAEAAAVAATASADAGAHPSGDAIVVAPGVAVKVRSEESRTVAPGVSVSVSTDADTTAGGPDAEHDHGVTRVDLPGVRIVADDAKDTAQVRIGPLSVDAEQDEATVRLRRDVRLKGESLSPEKRGIRATFIYTGKKLGDGWRFVGYEAGGPKTGPLAVAVVRSRSQAADEPESAIHDDVKRLVRRNGGV